MKSVMSNQNVLGRGTNLRMSTVGSQVWSTKLSPSLDAGSSIAILKLPSGVKYQHRKCPGPDVVTIGDRGAAQSLVT